jgi:HSP20 family protein
VKDLVPVAWKSGISDLRDRALQAVDRWLPERATDDGSAMTAFWRTLGGPAVDIEDRDDTVVVSAELPGLDKKDFEVEVEADRLILRGEKKASKEKQEGNYYYSETSYGSFHRIIPLPTEVDRDKADATYKHGVLTVTLPKTEEAKARRITVKVS